MAIALGIDTGGTYTDAALVAYESGEVLASAKSLTTKHDLIIGIRGAIDAALQETDHAIELVSLSTTLATNAIVEGNGAPICALLIGYAGHADAAVHWPTQMGTERVAFIEGGHSSEGEELAPLDLAAARAAITEYAQGVSAFAVSSYFGTRNTTHELAVRKLVREMTGLPVTCGHELTHRLNAVRRATTVALNARLIPLICELIDAVEQAMIERGIKAPLMVVKGDGSLMDASMARERPIETILSGPAASVVGAQHLGNTNDLVVVDMGGTTTDIAVVKGGRPRLSPQGAQVGPWRTMVEAIDVHTAGVGGDSQVRLDVEDGLCVGPRRIVPLCLLAAGHESVRETLRRQVARPNRQATDGQFYVLQRRPESDAVFPSFWPELAEALSKTPLSFEEVNRLLSYPQLYARQLEELERRGVIVRAGLTPTDAAHVLGEYDAWDAEAARHGAALFATRMGLGVDDLCRQIVEQASRQMAEEIAVKLLNEDGSDDNCQPVVSRAFIRHLLDRPHDEPLEVGLQLHPMLVAIGAPVRTYFPRVAELLNGRLTIPAHSHVANAVGAVAGSVVYRVHVLVVPDEDRGGYRVHLPQAIQRHLELESAVEAAVAEARQAATEGAQRSGAEDIRITVERKDHSAPVGEEWGEMMYLQTDLDVIAVGRPRLASDNGRERG